jgi:hypothetical protein
MRIIPRVLFSSDFSSFMRLIVNQFMIRRKKMKKGIMVLALIGMMCGAAAALSAEETEERAAETQAVYLDFSYTILGLMTGGFGFGAVYEHALLPNVSVLGGVSFVRMNLDTTKITGVDFGVGARFYPLKSAVSKLFFEGMGLYSPIFMENESDKIRLDFFGVQGRIGWKCVSSSGVFLEPSVRYLCLITNPLEKAGFASYKPASIGGGLSIGFAF